jgi:hypothetical protein
LSRKNKKTKEKASRHSPYASRVRLGAFCVKLGIKKRFFGLTKGALSATMKQKSDKERLLKWILRKEKRRLICPLVF